MELHDWLLESRFISRMTHETIDFAQVEGSLDGVKFDSKGFVVPHRDSDGECTVIRKHPIGDVIDHSPLRDEIYHTAGVSNLPELVEKWQRWHLENIEPIANYSTSSRFGRNLFEQRAEKRQVARFVNLAQVRNGPLIRNSDTVVIPEGSSAFYVGLAIAAFKKSATIVTSNAALYREYSDNPAVAKSLNHFHLIGGRIDMSHEVCRSDHGGAFGTEAERGYETAITDNPTATVVIMPVSGLLPEDGPYATDDFVRQLKYAIIRAGLYGPRRVREFVFIADYSKHLDLRKSVESYGAPVMDRAEWQRLLRDNQERISLVTFPPPAIRAAHAGAERHVVSRRIENLSGSQPFTEIDRSYVKVTAKLGELFYDGGTKVTLHEADSDGVHTRHEEEVAGAASR